MTNYKISLILSICITLVLILVGPPWITSDVEVYMNMVRGLEVDAPFSGRPLIPWVISLLGGTYSVFVCFNLLLFMVAIFIYSEVHGPLTTLVFVVGSFHVLCVVIPTPMLESAIIFVVSLCLWLEKKEYYEAIAFVWLLSIGIHPIAYILIGIIVVTNKRIQYGSWTLSAPILLGAVFFYMYSPVSGTVLMPFLEIYKVIIFSPILFWIGFVSMKKDRKSLRAIFVLFSCLVFVFIGTYTEKMLYYLGLFFAPLVIETLRRMKIWLKHQI